MLLVDAPRRGQRHLERRDLVAELVDGLVPAGAGEAEASDVQGDLTGAKRCNRTNSPNMRPWEGPGGPGRSAPV
jgi:hypothetical protein